jgi:hypothetical protein
MTATWNPDIPFALMIVFLMFLLYVPDIDRGIRNYRRGRDLARQITAEHEARKALESEWQR